MFSKSHQRSAGFTLVELLVVLVILGLLAGRLGHAMKLAGASNTEAAKLEIEDFSAKLDIYRLATGRYPTAEEGLEALVKRPADVVGWTGPYLNTSAVPKDPWGNDYHYRYPGETGGADVWTLGADNREGGEGENADVKSWE